MYFLSISNVMFPGFFTAIPSAIVKPLLISTILFFSKVSLIAGNAFV